MDSEVSSTRPHLISFYLLMVASMGLGTVSLGNVGGGNIRLWEIFLVAVLTGGLIKTLLKQKFVLVSRISIVLVTFLALSVLLSGLNAFDLYLYIKQTLLLFAMLVLFMVVAQRSLEGQLVQNLRWVAYPGILVAGWGGVEVTLYPEDLTVYASNFGLWPRARGFNAEANEFSQYLVVPFGFIFSTLVYYKPLRRWEAGILGVGLLVILIAQILTFSRGGLLAIAAQIVVWFILSRFGRGGILKKLMWFMLILIALIGMSEFLDIIFGGVFYVVWERLESLFQGGDLTTLSRIETMTEAFESATYSFSTLFFGIGFGNLPTVLGANTSNSANIFTDVFAETGLVGLFVICSMVCIILIISVRTLGVLVKINSQKLLAVFYGAYLSFVGLLVGGMTSPTLMLNYFWFCGGILMALHEYGRRQRVAVLVKA